MKAKWITPVVTALDENGHIDTEANKRIYEHLIQGGIDGILIFGSIGEFFALPMEEKKDMVREAVACIDHRVTVYIGTNSMEFEECVEFSNFALDAGADGVMVISPYYFNLPDSAVENFYDSLADRVNGPVLLYNFPARTGYDLKPEVILGLVRRHKNIVGIKDTVGTMGHTRAIIQAVKREFPEFLVYSGFDEFFAHNVLSGGDGCIAGLSNFAPAVAAGFAGAARNNDLAAMQAYQQKIDSLMAIYDVAEQFIPIIKKAMVLCGVEMDPACAAPLLSADENETEKIREILKQAEII
ncbi:MULTISPECIES: dihydrodipicolinate synthase family protein [Blautia]|uniref:dihydrodipicolinate synthase family protein n=1 Tax=Blautia TaxID=572511 RepID=UPI000BA3C07F|nr:MULTISPECIES: dihydrodipicolinate synthase family protein [Blautia]